MNKKKNTRQPIHSNKENEDCNPNIVNNVSQSSEKQVNHSKHGIVAILPFFFTLSYETYYDY